MDLLDVLTEHCADEFYKYGGCQQCSHPSGKCSGSCLKCSEEVNYHRPGGRTNYDCQKFMYYYVCRYSWKYCSEIMYALEQIDLSAYPAYNILSIGCGGAPDLMAFEKIRSAWDEVFYKGYNINPYWEPIHNAINQYANEKDNFNSEFKIKDIFEVLSEKEPSVHHYNVIVLEYFLSHFLQHNVKQVGEKLFESLIANILANRLDNSPFLFLINDIDHFEVRDCFDILIKNCRMQDTTDHVNGDILIQEKKSTTMDQRSIPPAAINFQSQIR